MLNASFSEASVIIFALSPVDTPQPFCLADPSYRALKHPLEGEIAVATSGSG